MIYEYLMRNKRNAWDMRGGTRVKYESIIEGFV